MNWPCPNSVRCPGDDNPFDNYSAEDPDPPLFLGYSTGTSPTSSFRGGGGGGPIDSNNDGAAPSAFTFDNSADTGTGGFPPPLGSTFDNPIVTTFSQVTDPTVDPNSVAGNDNLSQLASNDGTPGNGGWRNSQRFPPSVFLNQPQTCVVTCPDGLPFQYTVPLGTFRSFSQATANQAALSLACKRAQINALCLGPINPNACVGLVYNQTITANTANVPVTFSVVSGSLPAWLHATPGPDSIQLAGTPEIGDIGVTHFFIEAEDAFGFTMVKDYSVSVTNCAGVCMVVETVLPPFQQGHAYSAQLHATGGTAPYTWSLVEGQLPQGLSLSTSGAISGIATLVNGNLDSVFTVLATDSSSPANQCEGTISLPVWDYNNFPPGKHYRISGYSDPYFNLGAPFCCSPPAGPANVWNGSWDTQQGPSSFISSQRNVGGSVSADAGWGVSVFLTAHESGPEWWIVIACTVAGTGGWTGKKIGSNHGAKLDSPVGTYTLDQTPFGSTCAQNPTVILEEF